MKYYRFCATLDKRTSAQCRAKDGKIFPVDEAKAGSNLPPLHPHCRSTVVASLKADSKARGERVARNDNGRLVVINANTTYTDWKNTVLEHSKPSGGGDWKVKSNGSLIVTAEVPVGVKYRTNPIGRPNDVILHYGKNNQSEFDLYDTKGDITIQIHCGDHGMPKHHKFGIKGEHVATWEWIIKDGKWTGHPKPNRELTEKERKWVHDYINSE